MSYKISPYKLSESYQRNPKRYNSMKFRSCGNSGLKLPLISLGLWQNFSDQDNFYNVTKMVIQSFDLGITHFDLANNYGRPPGSAEINMGRILANDLKSYRDEIVISSKAGYDMWPGPYGTGGSRKYLIASCDQSLKRLGIDYVDIFYSHRFDKDTPLFETMYALDQLVRQGKALYVGISTYSPEQMLEASTILKELKTPCLVHQASYSIFNRWIEKGLIETLEKEGMGCIAFSTLAQGLLSDKYLNGIPKGSRASKMNSSLPVEWLKDDLIQDIKSLNDIALQRGQTLSQMSIAWTLKDDRITSVLIGASHIDQILENIKALDAVEFSAEELKEIDNISRKHSINLWVPKQYQ